MNDSRKPGTSPEENGAEESTKGFPVVSEAEQAASEAFEVKKKDKDGNWVAAKPVSVTDAAEQAAQETEEQPQEETAQMQAEETAEGQTTPPAEDAAQAAAAPAEETSETEEPAEEDVRVYEPEETGKKPSHVKRAAIGVLGAAAVIVGGFSAFVYGYGNIFPGVKVADEYKLGGMSQEEAKNYIAGEVQKGVFDRELKLTGKDLGTDTDKEYVIKLSDVDESVDSENAAKQAYLIGREGSYFQRVGTVLNSMFSGWDISLGAKLKDGAVAQQVEKISGDLAYEPVQPSWKVDKEKSELQIDTGKRGLSFDKEKLSAAIAQKMETVNLDDYTIETSAVDQEKPDAKKIAEDVNCSPKNATVDKKDGKTVLEAVDGVKVEESAIASALGDASEQSYTVPVEVTKAKITKAQLEPVLFRDRLGSATTYYNGGQGSRTTNLRLASRYCDGVILNPGEEFSYNDTVGERTASRGFRSAIIFQDNKEVSGLGGGVCQPSSTIYMAALRADLEISERHYHMFQVSYTPVSQDATVAYGSKDFRFVNNTDYPIKLDISAGGGSLTVNIIGTKTVNKEVSLYAKTYVSGSYKHATLYKTVTIDGKSTTTKENSSSYKLK